MKDQTGVIIGRFQPFHEGHGNLLHKALESCRQVVLFVGSACTARSIRNPFTAEERIHLIKANLGSLPEAQSKIHLIPLRDTFFNESIWIEQVRNQLKQKNPDQKPFVLFHFESDPSLAFYQKHFLDWGFQSHPCPQNVQASKLRENYLRDASSIEKAEGLSSETRRWLKNFALSPDYLRLKEEQQAIDKNQKDWSQAPYPPIFVTTDSIVTQAGHLLLILRGNAPAKGLWALPGGFIDQDETLFDCALRELQEETQIEISKDELVRSFVRSQTFDHPLRSIRKRTITHAFHFDLEGATPAPMKSGDDATEAKWVPIDAIENMVDQFAEDHYHMIRSFIPNKNVN